MLNNLTSNKKGFTIIELLIVIAIIGLLATISIVALNGARVKGRDAKRIGDMKQIQTALDLYFVDNNSYPSGTFVLGGDTNAATADAKVLCVSATGFQADSTGCGKVYMSNISANPQPPVGVYNYTSDGLTYSITFSLEEATGGYTAGVHTVTPAGIN